MAEWLEFELNFPDGRKETTRRALLERAGLAWRQAAQPNSETLRPMPRDSEGPTSPREVHNIWFSAGPHHLSHYANALLYFARGLKSASRIASTVINSAMATSIAATFAA